MNQELPLVVALPHDLAWRVRRADLRDVMSPCESAVLKLLANPLKPCLGANRAMQISTMQDIWRDRHERIYADRLIKQSVKTLIEERDVPIGSSRTLNKSGYYLICCDAEAQSTVRTLSAEIRSLAKRCHALSPKSDYVRGLLGQLTVELGAE